MKTILIIAGIAIAAWIATGHTRTLIKRLALAVRNDEPYGSHWWVQEIHYIKPRDIRSRLGRYLALQLT